VIRVGIRNKEFGILMVRALRALGSRAAGGSFRGGRERPPYNPPQMGAGKRNVSRKGKVSGFACRLPCIVGRAISPAGKRIADRKLCGTVRAWNRKAVAAGNFRGGRERPPYNSPQMGAGKRNVGRKGKVSGFACRLPCIVGRAISPAGQRCAGRKLCRTVRALPAAKNPPTASKGRASIPHS